MTLPLPEGSVLLHVGPQKTGSTAIQQALHARRETLAEHGVFYPGPHFRQAEAGWAVLGIGSAVGRPPPRLVSWERLVSDVRRAGLPRTCVSNEDFARATPSAAAKIVADLGGERVHLVYVCRRLDRLLPSHWQERVKARMTWSYPEYLHRMTEPDDGSWEWSMMWGPHDVGAVLDRWSSYVDRARMTVIVADEKDHDLLPRTFASLLGLSGEELSGQVGRANRSLSYQEAEAVRRVNQVFAARGWDGETYRRVVQRGIADTVKSSTRPSGARPVPGLPSDVLAVVHDRADAQADAVAASGVRVIGDPSSLRTRGHVEPDDKMGSVEEVPLEVFGTVVAGAIQGALKIRHETPPPSGIERFAAREVAAELGRRVVRRVRR